MQQPPGYIDAAHPTYVCKLHKSLYGLKQAPRAWFERFTFHLIHLGFQASFADNSLFIFHSKSTIIYLLLYVDDIILIGNNSKHIASLVTALKAVFELKDLGELNYFLGVQISRTPVGLHLTQSKYASNILHRFHMENNPQRLLAALLHGYFFMMVLLFLTPRSIEAWLGLSSI